MVVGKIKSANSVTIHLHAPVWRYCLCFFPTRKQLCRVPGLHSKGEKEMTANKKKTTGKSRKKSPRKTKTATKKRVQKTAVSFATFLDDHMIAGVTWAKLEKLAVVEADRRRITSQRTVAALQAHARSRGYQDQWTVKMDNNKVKMTRSHKEVNK